MEEASGERESLNELKDPLSSSDVEDVQSKSMAVDSDDIVAAQCHELRSPCETVTSPVEGIRPSDVDLTADAVRESLRLDSDSPKAASSVEDLQLQSSSSSLEDAVFTNGEFPEMEEQRNTNPEGANEKSDDERAGRSIMDGKVPTPDTAVDSDSDEGLLPLSRRLRRIFSDSEEEENDEDKEKKADRSRIEDPDHATEGSEEGSVEEDDADGIADRSDSTSSDDEPPPAFGRWMTSGGAAKKAPRTPGAARGDSGVSGEERSPKASRRTKAEAENLIAIHSESQRMVREAEVNLPYHEPRQFSKFSEFKAMLDEEEEEEGAAAAQQHHRRRKRSPTPPAQCPAVENLDAQKAATAEWIESLPSKPSSPSSESQSSKTGETATRESAPVMAASTPYHSKSAEPRKLSLPIPQINFDVDLDACSLPDQSSIHGSSTAAPKKEEEAAPLALRLRLNNRLMNALRQDELNCVPKLGSPDHSGFIDLNPKKEQFPDRSFDSTGSTHPMLRRLRRHMKPSPRDAKRVANKSIEIITKTEDDVEGERLKLEEIRLMPPPPNPPRLSASSRAANWKAHREQLKEEMRIKRLKGLEERQRFWDIIHKEEEEETKHVRSLDDMDSDDEEFVPGEESEEESEDDDEEEEEEENADDEEEEEEETRRNAGRKSEFIDEEAEEEDEEPRFDGSLPNSPIDLRLPDEDDEAVMADDEPSCKSTSLYSRKLSMTSTTRDLFASDPEEISSVRSSVSSIFQPGQRSYIIPDEMSLHSGVSNRRISETYQLAEGQAPAEATLVWNEQQNSAGYDDLYDVHSKADSASREPTPMASPVKLSTQGAHSLFSTAPNWLDGDMDEVAADLFATQNGAHGTQLSQADLFATSLSHNRSSLESGKADSEDDEVVVTAKRKSRVLAESSDEDAEDADHDTESADHNADSAEEEADHDAESVDHNADSAEEEADHDAESVDRDMDSAEEEADSAEEADHDDADTEYESDGMVDEDDDEMAVMKRIEAQSGERRAPKLSEFVEAEAELSGSEGDVSSDENELGLDREDEEDAEWIDKDSSVGDARLRQEVERVHARMERDDDQRAVRYLQELYLPDGDLTPGESLRKRFRWRGLDDQEDEEEAGPYIESEDDDEENQISFIDDQRPPGNLNVSTASANSETAAAKEVEEEEASQLFRLGQNALQTKLRLAPDMDQPQSQARSQMSGFGLVKRGSFLSKATSDLGRIRDILRQSDNASLRNKAGVVCFSVGAGSETAAKKQSAPKRPSTEGYEHGKKICLSGKPLTSMNSIFNSIDGK